jgi:hypothetical protein
MDGGREIGGISRLWTMFCLCNMMVLLSNESDGPGLSYRLLLVYYQLSDIIFNVSMG